MHISMWLLILAILVLVALVVFALRRRGLLLMRGAIEMSVYRGHGFRGGWALGVASYAGDELLWYRMSSFRPGPSLRISRQHTEIESRSEPTSRDAIWMPPESIVLHLSTAGGRQDVAVRKSSLPGLLSWWESAPPSWAADPRY